MEHQPVPPAPTEPKPKGRPSWLIPAVIAGLALVIGVGIGQSGGGDDPATVAATSPSESPDDGGMVLDSPEPEPVEPDYATLQARDLQIKLKTIESSCYGSAGGLMTVRLNVGIDGTTADNLDPSVQWDVTYRLTGDENGPIVGTFRIYPDGQYDVNEEYLSTPTCATKPQITVTDVEGF
jgi:hypothetical protein